jgi:hypothetical protein
MMSTLSRSEQLRKAICGSCLIAAPALLLVGVLLPPEEPAYPAHQYEIISSSAGRWDVNWIITTSLLLMVGAVIGLAHLLHERRPAEAMLGGAVALGGVLALFVVAAETVIVPELGPSSQAGAAAQPARTLEFGSTRGTVVLVAVLLLPVGLVAMGYGLYRADVAPTWASVALGLGALLFAASLPTGLPAVSAIGLAAMAVGMAWIGWEVLDETDEQWEHPPRLGTRPAT